MENTISEVIEPQNSKKSLGLLWAANIILLLAISVAGYGIWYQNKNDNPAISANSNGTVLGASTKDPQYLISLTDSLKANNFVLYGDAKQTKTKKQLAEFGQAVDYLDYVECDSQVKGANPQECLAKDIEVYPTWVSGTKKFPGYMTLQELEKLLTTYSFDR